jgi:hypothetical protein
MNALLMQAASTSAPSVNFYRTTRPNNSEDSHLHVRHSENLKYSKEIMQSKTLLRNVVFLGNLRARHEPVDIFSGTRLVFMEQIQMVAYVYR